MVSLCVDEDNVDPDRLTSIVPLFSIFKIFFIGFDTHAKGCALSFGLPWLTDSLDSHREHIYC